MSQRFQRDYGEFIRTSDFFPEKSGEGMPVAERESALNEAGVRSAFASHLAGEDQTAELYTLLTILSMPVTRDIAGYEATDRLVSTGPDDQLGVD